MDWVANNESWDLTTPPFIMDPGANNVVDHDHSNALNCMLTFHQDLVDNDNQFGVPQLEHSVVRVVGDIHFGMMAFSADILPTVNVHLTMHLRIVVATQVPDAVYASEIDQVAYNMDEPWVANDDFLWHYRASTVLSNSFWSGDVENYGDWRHPVRVPVDVRVGRRLKQREVLVLSGMVSQRGIVATAGTIVFNRWADLRLWYEPCLRTLVRTNT